MAMSPEYAAGLFDGEGTIGMHLRGDRDRPTALRKKVALGGKFKPSILELQKTYGGWAGRVNASNKNYPDFRCWKWEITSVAHVRRFLEDVLPFLREKRSQAVVMLAYLNGHLTPEEARETLWLHKALTT